MPSGSWHINLVSEKAVCVMVQICAAVLMRVCACAQVLW
jgi:hypothetical protein